MNISAQTKNYGNYIFVHRREMIGMELKQDALFWSLYIQTRKIIWKVYENHKIHFALLVWSWAFIFINININFYRSVW